MDKTTKYLLIAAGVVVAYMLLTRPSATGTNFMGMKTPTTATTWEKAGQFLGSTFGSWFGSTPKESTGQNSR